MLPSGYELRSGSPLDRALLLRFARRAYREIEPDRDGEALAATVERYLSPNTPLWWVEIVADDTSPRSHENPPENPPAQLPHMSRPRSPIACLWLGTATASTDGQPQCYVLLIYVEPEHRRRGIATGLLRQAEEWAQARGDRQVGLQVMVQNEAAIALYRKLGYAIVSHWMAKPLR